MNLPFETAYQHYEGRVPIRSYGEFMKDFFIAAPYCNTLDEVYTFTLFTNIRRTP